MAGVVGLPSAALGVFASQPSRVRRHEGGALVRGEGLEHCLLNAVEDRVEAVERAATGSRDAHDVAAAVGGIRIPLDEAAAAELVERGHHVAAVDAGVASEVGLAARPVLVERREEPVVVATEALSGSNPWWRDGRAAYGTDDGPGRSGQASRGEY